MPNFQENKAFEVAPKGAAELVEVITLYERSGKKVPPDTAADLCNELNDINIFVIKIALRAYKAKVARERKPYHPKYFINLTKKLAKRIKNIPESFHEREEDLIIPNLGRAI